MAKYKITKGPVSKIRTDKAEVSAMLAKGYVLDGEINDVGVIIDPNPVLDSADPLAELKAELVSLGIAPSIVERYRSEKTLREKIEEAKANANDAYGKSEGSAE